SRKKARWSLSRHGGRGRRASLMKVQSPISARAGAGLWSSFAAPVLRAPMVPVFVIAFVLFCFTVEGFTSVANLSNMARLFAPLLIAAIGATFVFLLGGIDLSVGSTLSLASVVGASLMRDTGSISLGVAGGVGTGLVIGAS